MMDNFNINRRKFISVGAALSLGIPFLGKTKPSNTGAPKMKPGIQPEWRTQKGQRIVSGEMKAPVKAYRWALQNQNISAVISNLWDEQHVNDNLSVAGKKVELQPG
ncbi:hypothetical protein [Cyclobacterium salsum]|uniref:hypothetical protein n=1 Tax=Cyclobacterium salsum TaxID=2666329 RepID=UPI0013919426|nr:hypothetical protein [Cyclobacterium salsum]